MVGFLVSKLSGDILYFYVYIFLMLGALGKNAVEGVAEMGVLVAL